MWLIDSCLLYGRLCRWAVAWWKTMIPWTRRGATLRLKTDRRTLFTRTCVHSLLLPHFTTTTTTVLRPFVWDYPGEPVPEETSPTHTYPDHRPSFISFLHLLRSIASSLFNLRAWQSFCTISVQVFFGLPLWPGTLHFILHTFLHPIIVFFSQHMPIPSQPVLLSTEIMSSNPSLSLNSLLGSLSSAISFISAAL